MIKSEDKDCRVLRNWMTQWYMKDMLICNKESKKEKELLKQNLKATKEIWDTR